MNTYREFIDDVVEEVAELTATTESRKHAVKHIESFLELHEQTLEAEAAKEAAFLREHKNDGTRYFRESGGADSWFYPPQLSGKEANYPALTFREPTEQERIDFCYTLLAIINDGQKQGPFPHHRIYFEGEGVSKDSTYTLHYKDSAATLCYGVWSYYVTTPLDEQFAKSIDFAKKESQYRHFIQDALNVVRNDLPQKRDAGTNAGQKGNGKPKPEETKQNVTPAKHWKIIAWAKELCGLAIERITKAYLDKYG
jgi:hypothetical protein